MTGGGGGCKHAQRGTHLFALAAYASARRTAPRRTQLAVRRSPSRPRSLCGDRTAHRAGCQPARLISHPWGVMHVLLNVWTRLHASHSRCAHASHDTLLAGPSSWRAASISHACVPHIMMTTAPWPRPDTHLLLLPLRGSRRRCLRCTTRRGRRRRRRFPPFACRGRRWRCWCWWRGWPRCWWRRWRLGRALARGGSCHWWG